ncbi:MAG: type II/IV secretion system protein [Clostridia bacterium]|nr:type II/IV secretion system protein [Clostridia bacterium]
MRQLGGKIQRSLDAGGQQEGPTIPLGIKISEDAGQMSAVKTVDEILRAAVSEKASDIHIEPRTEILRVRYRVDGILREAIMLPVELHSPLVSRIKIMANMDIAEKRLPQDGRIRMNLSDREIDIRVSSLPTIHGEKVVLRLLDKKMRLLKLEELGFSKTALDQYSSLIHQPYGMILVTGPAGSGKTTTLYATLNKINSVEKNIITIEDPVEYMLTEINQMSVNTKAGLTFAAGLRTILRQDPDVIMVGEIRDSETAKIAIRAANTGHLVLSTLHTNNAASALTRLVDMGVEPYLVASSVIGVVAQRLVRKICPQCKKSHIITDNYPRDIPFSDGIKSGTMVYKGAGCDACGQSGYRGRLAVAEILKITPDISEKVVRKEPTDNIYRHALKNHGYIPMVQDGIQKVCAGTTTLEELAGTVHN